MFFFFFSPSLDGSLLIVMFGFCTLLKVTKMQLASGMLQHSASFWQGRVSAQSYSFMIYDVINTNSDK